MIIITNNDEEAHLEHRIAVYTVGQTLKRMKKKNKSRLLI